MSLDLHVEKTTIDVGIQLQLTIQPGLQNVGAKGCRVDLAQRLVGIRRREWLRQWHSKTACQQMMMIREAHRLTSCSDICSVA